MNNNLRHWSALDKTDPKHTKPFDRGRFKGTATKPIYHELRMTEHFGPCGLGWGMERPEFQMVPVGNEVVVYCTVALWYMDGGAKALVYGVGGDKVLRVEKNGPFISDEAYKSAFTDAVGNAIKHIGVGADVHMGLFEDSKYIAAAKREFAGGQEEEQPQPKGAGMVRADDVPPNGNGQQAERRQPIPAGDARAADVPPTNLGPIQQRAEIFRDEMKERFARCKVPADVDTLIKNNGKALDGVKAAAPDIYAEIMAASTNTKNEMYASA